MRQYFGTHSESIPMSFVLGFYVTLVVGRWWQQYKLLPWPDTLALFVSAAIPGAVSSSSVFSLFLFRFFFTTLFSIWRKSYFKNFNFSDKLTKKELLLELISNLFNESYKYQNGFMTTIKVKKKKKVDLGENVISAGSGRLVC